MSSYKHNKKRNVGIIYELLLSAVSQSLVENNKRKLKKITSILENRFKKGTELYKEFRLFNALVHGSASNTHVVAGILTEAKAAARRIDTKKLQKEKSDLIRDINYKLNDQSFFHRKVKNYRDYGTVQMVVNEWRNCNSPDLKKIIDLETKLISQLLSEKKISNLDDIEKSVDKNNNKLVYKIMSDKFNKKYGETLNESQKEIINKYVFYSESGDANSLSLYFKNKKNEALRIIESLDVANSLHLNSKIDSVKQKIKSLNEQNVNDETIVKFLTLSKLLQEIGRGT
jgi:hypothetical protein